MDKKIFTLSVYNTITKEYEDVVVTEEIFNTYRRSYWNEDKNDKRHKIAIPFSNLKCCEDGSIENFREFASEQDNPDKSDLHDTCFSLEKGEIDLLKATFIRKLTLREYSEISGIPTTTLFRRKRDLLDKIKKL